jgi:hypothetical protein
MFSTGTQVMIHSTGRKTMTHESAKKVRDMFDAIGGFDDVKIMELGWDSGCWYVELWAYNARAGNRNLEEVYHVPTDAEAVLIAKTAKGKANKRDAAALARIATQRAVDAE